VLLGFFKIFQQKQTTKKLHEKVCTTWVTQNAMLFIQEGQLPLVGPSSIEKWVIVSCGHAQS
jgi:hypothetical protein